MSANIHCRQLGRQAYEPVWQAMQAFTTGRVDNTPDEIWVVEHEPVYTLGLAGDPSNRLFDNGIPMVKTDRGGQITYHGPGQVVIYPLIDLRQHHLTVKPWVALLEQVVIDTLASLGIANACRKPGAPGVYIPQAGTLAKIAALGIKIRQGCSYHGLSLNVDMDLSPFEAINPCGYQGLETIDLATLGVKLKVCQVADLLCAQLMEKLS